MNGPLWYSGAVARCMPLGSIAISSPTASRTWAAAGWVETMSFGRPVLPPEVGAFQLAAIRGSSGASSSGSSSPGVGGSVSEMTSADAASSTIAARSGAGIRWLSGCGTAQSLVLASTASKKAIPFGSAMLTMSSGLTPSSA